MKAQLPENQIISKNISLHCVLSICSGRDDAWLSKESDFKVGQKCDYRYQVSFKYDKCKGSHSQYSSNEIRKTQNEYLNIVCQNLN